MMPMWKGASCQLTQGGCHQMERPDAASDRQWRTGNNGQQPMSQASSGGTKEQDLGSPV